MCFLCTSIVHPIPSDIYNYHCHYLCGINCGIINKWRQQVAQQNKKNLDEYATNIKWKVVFSLTGQSHHQHCGNNSNRYFVNNFIESFVIICDCKWNGTMIWYVPVRQIIAAVRLCQDIYQITKEKKSNPKNCVSHCNKTIVKSSFAKVIS